MKFLEHELEYRRATQHLSRREALRKMGAGIGSIGLAGMLGTSEAATAKNAADEGSAGI